MRERALLATDRSVVISDPHAHDNPLVYVNPAFERLTGYRAEEVLGRNCRLLQGPDSDPAAVAQLRRAVAAGESSTALLLNYRADGTAFWNEVSVSPVLAADGALTHYVGVQSDVTSRVVAEMEREAALLSVTEARTTLESVLAATPVGLAFFDRELRFTRVNAAFAALSGVPIDQHLGCGLNDVFGTVGDEVGRHLGQVLDIGEPVLDIELEIAPSSDPAAVRCWGASFYPVLDAGNTLVRLGAVFTDVTDLRRGERERDELLERERLARRDAERVGEQVAMLARAMDALADTMNLDRSLSRFVAGLVPTFADWCAIDVADDQDQLRRVDGQAVDSALLEWERRSGRPSLTEAPAESIIERVFRLERPVRLADTTGEPQFAVLRRAGFGSMMVLPVRARGRTIGVLSLGRARHAAEYSDTDLALALDLASRAGLAIDNACLYQQEHRVAETLQRALLPPAVPEIDGLEICVQYQPGADGVQVGGDWYDVVGLEDGSVALSIGDVVGHDLDAAVRMSQLRTVLRAETTPESAEARSPSLSVDRLDRFARRYGSGFVATLLHGVLDPRTGVFTYVRAGHLPLAIVAPGGSVHIVDRDDGSPPLGLGQFERSDHTVDVPPGATLVLYTDGLIERRGETLDEGFSRLVAALAGSVDPLGGWCDQVLGALAPAATTNDDVAILLARRTLDA